MKNPLYALAFLCLFAGSAVGQDYFGDYTPQESPPAEEQKPSPPEPVDPNARIVSEQEFYFYDVSKMRTPLVLSRKAAVRFFGKKTDEEKKAYLANYSATEIESIVSVYPRAEYALGYLPTMNMKTMVGTIKKLSADQALEVAPVFIVDGMEAVVDGIYLETATPMSRDAVALGVKNVFGTDAMIHEITPEGHLWHISFKRLFFLGDSKLPLHVVSLANFLERSPKLFWVKRAYPKFAFLRDPVIATLAVTPVTGTVGEERTVTLSIRIFGKTADEVVVDEESIPEFMQGKFVPIASDKPPQSSFFDVRTTAVKEARKQVGPNEWYIERKYTFGLYAPEPEWVISGSSISYEYKKEKKTATVSPVTFFVRAHLNETYKLADIPGAYLMPMPGFSGVGPTPEKAKTEWFDPLARVVGGRGHLSTTLFSVGFVTALLALFLSVQLVMRHMAKARAGRFQPRVWSVGDLDGALGGAGEIEDPQGAYRALHDVLSTLLHQRFPEVPEQNATLQHVKEIAGGMPSVFQEGAERSFVGLEELFEDLERRHAPEFLDTPTEVLKSDRASIEARIRQLGEALRNSEGGGG